MNLTEIELTSVTVEKKHILENLMCLYLYDLSEFADDIKIDENGRFEYEGMNLYFSEQDLKPFFIYLKDEIVGFVLLNSGKFVCKDVDYSVHELFILKAFRKKGIARAATKKLLDIYKGVYVIQQLSNNKNAVEFWRNFYKNEGIEYEEKIQIVDGFECCVQKIKMVSK